ncbi:MAG TPA: hypothetical protein VF979_04900, partial [Streptosporangiaceae bacterium]
MVACQPAAARLAARLSLIAIAVAVAAIVSLAVAATVSDVSQWGSYAGGEHAHGRHLRLIGALPSRVSGVFVAFLIPFIDLGIDQSPMLRAGPTAWAHFLPGYGADQIVMNSV